MADDQENPTVRFAVSFIVDRIKSGHAEIEWMIRYDRSSVHHLWFEVDNAWFYMKLWLDGDEPGFLRDPVCHYNIIADIPMQALYDAANELLVLHKIGDSPYLNPPYAYSGLGRFGSDHSLGCFFGAKHLGWQPRSPSVFMI
jgi:hypothetical protein